MTAPSLAARPAAFEDATLHESGGGARLSGPARTIMRPADNVDDPFRGRRGRRRRATTSS